MCGLPRNMDGTEGSRCVKSRRFAARLATACGVPVVLWDERRTTVTAAGILSANSTFGADRKARLDSVSAAVILESFLAWRKPTPAKNRRRLPRPLPRSKHNKEVFPCLKHLPASPPMPPLLWTATAAGPSSACLPASFGHKAGFDRLREITRYAVGDRGINVLRLYVFSTENFAAMPRKSAT